MRHVIGVAKAKIISKLLVCGRHLIVRDDWARVIGTVTRQRAGSCRMVADVSAGSESIEGIWNQTKYGELSNLTTDKLETLKSRVEWSIAVKQEQTEFLQGFVSVAGLEQLGFISNKRYKLEVNE